MIGVESWGCLIWLLIERRWVGYEDGDDYFLSGGGFGMFGGGLMGE